ncbi:MAG: hypothetical protein B7Y51_03980 [Burkholderiales bacterium 28-67-8]|nr:MAG: hypothetical protein B7Y51_03980 [Burkholderiales bacterium 28-67-8]
MLKLWDAIDGASKAGKGAFLIYQESSLVIRAIRDYFTADVGEILIDTDDIYEQAQQFMAHVMPEMAAKVKRYRDDAPLFSRFQIEHQIETAFSRTVNLPSGGAIVIDHTEALVSVDVNSARSTRGSDIEETATRTNLEAADEIARQMRLRDLGGLIVVDFIDMDESKNRREVETRLREALRPDRARVQVSAISKFGLLELSRQRLRPALSEGSHITCPRCNGTGHIRDTESSALQILRMVQEESMKENTAAVHVQVPVEVTSFLLNEKRTEITKIELKQRVTVLLVPNKNLDTPNYRLERLRHDDPRLENLQASYTMIEEASEETGVTRREKTAPKQEPVVKGVLPETPAPAPAPKPAPVPVAAPVAAPAASGGFFGWLGRFFSGSTPAAAPAAAPSSTGGSGATSADAGRGDRNGRGGRGGRGGRDGRDGKKPERTGEARPEGRGGERGRPGRGPRTERTDEMAAADTGMARDDRAARTEPRAEAGAESTDENRRSRGGRGGRGRGDRAERDARTVPGAEAVTEENGLPAAVEVDAEGNLMAPAAEGAEAAEGSEAREGSRRRRRGGRGGRDRNADRPAEAEGEHANDLPITSEDGTAAQAAPAPEATEGGERDSRRRSRGGRGRGERGEARTDGESAVEAGAEAAAPVSESAEAAPAAVRPVTSIVAAEVVETAPVATPVAPAPVVEAVAAPAPVVVEQPVVVEAEPVAVAAPVVVEAPVPAPAPVAVAAPAVVPAPAVVASAAPFVLETDALVAVAETAGLQWVNSDADKIRAAQQAMASEPKPEHVPRVIKPTAAADNSPLVMVETRKDLSQVTLPFESDKPSA